MTALDLDALAGQDLSNAPTRRPRLGFLGLGWTGRARLQALVAADVADIAAVADLDPVAAREAAVGCGARACWSLDALLGHALDGVVIATPNALHATQVIEALQHGVAVFCQKPLARTAAETRRVVAKARAADRLLGVDFGHRHVAGIAELRRSIRDGELGDVHAIDLVFHNAHGQDKGWFYDLAQSGGGCVMDAGVPLIDLAMWMTDCTRARKLDARLYRLGCRLRPPLAAPEDYASVQFDLDNGACVRLACSWRLPAGAAAVIEAAFYGTRGGGALRNVDGSFHDFTVDRFDGTHSQRLGTPPDAWSGRALEDWARQLAHGAGFDEGVARAIDVAAIVDKIHGR